MTQIDTSTEAVEVLILNSLKFSNLAAGEGFVLFGVSPEDFLFAYSKATGFEDWDNIGQHIIAFMRAERDALQAEIEEWKEAATSRHPNPADHRYWEGRYRDEKAENERLKAQTDAVWNDAIEAAGECSINNQDCSPWEISDAILTLKRQVKGESHE